MTWHLSRHLPYRLSPYCLQNCLYHLPKHLMLQPRHQDVLSDSRKYSEICPNDDYNKQVKSQTTLVKLHVPQYRHLIHGSLHSVIRVVIKHTQSYVIVIQDIFHLVRLQIFARNLWLARIQQRAGQKQQCKKIETSFHHLFIQNLTLKIQIPLSPIKRAESLWLISSH